MAVAELDGSPASVSSTSQTDLEKLVSLPLSCDLHLTSTSSAQATGFCNIHPRLENVTTLRLEPKLCSPILNRLFKINTTTFSWLRHCSIIGACLLHKVQH